MWALHTLRAAQAQPRLPWEMGQITTGPAVIPSGFKVNTAVPEPTGITPGAGVQTHVPKETAARKKQSNLKMSSGRRPQIADATDRTLAVAKWVAIVQVFINEGIHKKVADVEAAAAETL